MYKLLCHTIPAILSTLITPLEGAMKLKFMPFCSSRDALSDEIIFLPKSKFSDFGQKPWTIVHGFFFWKSEKSFKKSMPP